MDIGNLTKLDVENIADNFAANDNLYGDDFIAELIVTKAIADILLETKANNKLNRQRKISNNNGFKVYDLTMRLLRTNGFTIGSSVCSPGGEWFINFELPYFDSGGKPE